MKRFALLLVVALVVASCASPSTPPAPSSQDLVNRAVQALGGADKLASVKTISLKGTMRQWEPEQSKVASGPLRFACESTFEMVADTGARAARTDWVRKFAYPAPRTFTYSEIVTTEAGYVAGIDSNGRTKQSLDSTPPAHSMSSLRLAATQRELQRASPLLFLDLQRNAGRLPPMSLVSVGGVTYPAVDYRLGNQTFTVMFDSGTGLPARIRTLDYDNIWGDVTYDLVLADWQTFDGVRMATTQKYELLGWPVAEVKITEARVNAPVAAERLAIPVAFSTGAPRAATGTVPYQWVIRRQFIGTYLDSDVPSYDTRASTGLRLVDLAPGVQHVTGGSHHSLLVEMRDHLVVFDAPVSDWQSNWVLAAARAKYPNKPVKYLVLTHHHMDHAGGLRAYAAQGAVLVVGQGTAAHYRRVLAAPFTRNPDLPARDLSKTEIIEVTDKRVFTDGQQTVEAYLIANPHADGMLIGYIPAARLGFVTDLWSPGAGPPLQSLNPGQAAVVAGVKQAGIAPEKFAGGHGSVADYAPFAALEGK